MSSYNSHIGNAGGASALPATSSFNTPTNTKGSTLSSPQKPNQNMGALLDKLFKGTTMFFAALVLLLLVSIIVSLFIGSWPALKTFGLPFFSSAEWNPVTEEFGALVPIYGTIVTSIIAMLIAVPLSFGIALFISLVAYTFVYLNSIPDDIVKVDDTKIEQVTKKINSNSFMMRENNELNK